MIRNLYGIENISHVPGTIGASVVQNIGCYGQEVSESVVSLKAFDFETMNQVEIYKPQMYFSYRKSRFNDSNKDKGRFIITSVIFRLGKEAKLNTNYGDIQKYFENHKKIRPTLQTIRNAIISIRDSKFPFPDSPKHGTAGSFWNVDVVDDITYKKITKKLLEKGFKNKAEEMISRKSVFTVAQGFKIVPGLFIEALGFKGKQSGGAKILDTHAGIISNFTGKARAMDIIELSDEITNAVYKEFGVRMKIEPELVGDFKII